jgi:anaerobic ribonucleoside-triphosphate reductase activating protein
MSVQEVSQWLLSIPEIEGVTLSGGEPMQQAGLLAEVLRQVRPHRDLGVVCYTGYRYEALRLPSQKALLEHVDLLIDGPYRQDLHADLLWRASSNQRLLCLTNRYVLPADRSAGLEWSFQPDGRMAFAGVPPWPDYVASLS